MPYPRTRHPDPTTPPKNFDASIGGGHEFHRRGYASDALIVLLRYTIGERRYHNAKSEGYTYNEASLALHDHLGFQHEGWLVDHECFGGPHCDVDLIVDLTPNSGNELLRVAGLGEELSELLGVQVDAV